MHLLVIGASGIVGRLLCAELRNKPPWKFTLAGRSLAPLHELAEQFNPVAAVRQCDLCEPASLKSVLSEIQPDMVVNVAGNYTTTAVSVADACLAAKVMLFDICDEPKAMVPLRALHERAVAAGVPLVIGGGTAPQTSCALLRLVMEQAGSGVRLQMGYVLGLNRYGPNAVQTVSRGVSGLMSHDQPADLWSVGPEIGFPAPFGPLQIRKYPVPETVLLDGWPGVDEWYAGARLSWGWLNRYIRLLQKLRMTEWGVTRFWNAAVAGICRGVYQSRLGAPGIAIGIEAHRNGNSVVGQLYHPEMSRLTADALAVALEHFADHPPSPGVWWGHEVVPPSEFLQALAQRGASWRIQAS